MERSHGEEGVERICRKDKGHLFIYLFIKFRLIWLVGFVALRPKSTAMVIAGRSVHLTTLFPGQA